MSEGDKRIKEIIEKEKKFVEKYLEYKLNGIRATNQKIAEEVGLVENGKKFRMSTRLRRAIAAAESYRDLELARVGVDRAKILETLLKIACVDARIFFKEDGTLKDFKDLPTEAGMAIAAIELYKNGKPKTIRLWDKVKSLELLGKEAGMFTEKIEVKNDIIDKIREAREKMKVIEAKIIKPEIEQKKENEDKPNTSTDLGRDS